MTETTQAAPDPAPASAPEPRFRRLPVVILLAFLAMFANAASWALTTPIGASPDEPAHIVKAGGVVRGQIFGEDVDGTQTRRFTVPAGLADASRLALCNMSKPEVPFTCAPMDDAAAAEPVETTSTAGLYNPSYYALVGWPSLLDPGSRGILLMRLASAALVAAFAALAVGMLSRLPRGRLAVAAVAVAFTPMTWFLGGSVNPNGLEITATAAFFASLLVLLSAEPRGRLRWAVIAALVASGVVVTQVRTLGVVWLGAAVLVAVTWAGWPRSLAILRRGLPLVSAVAVLAAGGLAAVVALSTGTLQQNGVYFGAGTPFPVGFRVMLERTFLYLHQAIGLFGWGDTPAPPFTIDVVVAAMAALVGTVLLFRARTRDGAAVLAALGFAVLLPALIQAASVEKSGYIWQGRYSLPLLVVLVIVAALGAERAVERSGEAIASRLRSALAISAVLAAWAAETTALRRHALGYDTDTIAVATSSFWAPPVLPTGTWMLAFGVIAGLTAWTLLLVARRMPRPAEGDAPRDDAGSLEPLPAASRGPAPGRR